jgi:hypothetical protein
MIIIIIIMYVNTGLQVTDRSYELVPENVINANGTTIMWDVPVITGRTKLAN